MDLSNKQTPLVEVKTWCESAKDLKLTHFFSKYLFCVLSSFSQNRIIIKLIKKYMFSEGKEFPLRQEQRSRVKAKISLKIP